MDAGAGLPPESLASYLPMTAGTRWLQEKHCLSVPRERRSLPTSLASRLNERLTPARAQVGAQAAHAVEAEGKMLSLDEAIHLAMGQETRGL